MEFSPHVEDFEGRGLTKWMLRQLKDSDGILHPVLRAVIDDPERALELEIRRHYVNIYYRGGNLMEIRQSSYDPPRLTGFIDKRYIQKYADNGWSIPATPEELAVHEWLDSEKMLDRHPLDDRATVEKHVASFEYRRLAMDANKKRRPKKEREAQQKAALANSGSDSEYVVCDVEYSVKHEDPNAASGSNDKKTSFLDMVAAYRPEASHSESSPQLVLIELKYGVHAIDGRAGLREHVDDLSQLLAVPGSMQAVAEEVARMMRQKHCLGLTSVDIDSFDETTSVDYIIAVAGHNPRSQILRDALLGRNGLNEGRLDSPEGLNIKIVILDDDLVLRHDDLISLDSITEDRVPPEIFSGTLRERRYRKDELEVQ